MKELDLESVEINGLLIDLSSVVRCDDEKDLYEIASTFEP